MRGRRGDDLFPMAVVLAMLVVPAFLEPGDRLLGIHTLLRLPPCLFYRLTHVPCPLCGLTTSFALLIRGRMARAFLANPAGPLLYLTLAAWLVLSIKAFVQRRPFRPPIRISGYWFPALFITMWVLRLSAWLWAGR